MTAAWYRPLRRRRQRQAEARNRPLIMNLFEDRLREAADRLLAATPGAADLADAGRIRGADWRDLLAQLSGLPPPLVGALTGEEVI
jgi:hypothetical protein